MLINAKPIQKDKLNDQVYDQLCALLRQGEFIPGQAVRVARVAEAFGVSAMPVREALTRLQAIGVVANVSGRSLGVPSLEYDELTDLRNVRLEVEVLALKWAVENRDDAFLADLERLLDKLEAFERSNNIQGYVKANYEFHVRLYRQSKSPVLIDIIDTLWLRVSPHLYQLDRKKQYKVSNEHHSNIVKAIRAGNHERAMHHLVLDISDAYEDLMKTLFADSHQT